MTMTYDEGKPSLEQLQHSGVKGMKWGVHKAKPTDHEIGAARARQLVRAHDIGTARSEARRARKSGDVRAQVKAQNKVNKALQTYNTSEDRKTAARLQKGEKVALALLSGPVGIAYIGVHSVGSKLVDKSVDKARARA